jgi:DNA-binding CsgD family transcriptional regulator
MSDLHCPVHPGARVRRYRTLGPLGRGLYPQCVPADGGQPHLLAWEQVVATHPDSTTEVRVVPAAIGETGLTPSELAVLCAAANGLSTIETARHLGKSPETVKTQRRSILLKLGARNAPQAVCLATERGILIVGDGHAQGARAA